MEKTVLSLLIIFAAAGLSGCGSKKEPVNANLPAKTVTAANTNQAAQPAADAVPAERAFSIASDHYGFSLNYPGRWPEPEMQNTTTPSDGSYPAKEDPAWRLIIGPRRQTGCSGSDCADLYLDGLQKKDKDKALKEIGQSAAISLIRQEAINNADAIIYSESGACANKRALIFAGDYAVRLTARCGADDHGLGETFDQLLATFKFINKEPTFRDPDLGFTVKYPEHWSVARLNADSGAADPAGTKVRFCDAAADQACANNLTIEAKAREGYSYYGDKSISVESSKIVSLAGTDATRHVYRGPMGTWTTYLVLNDKNQKYSLTFSARNEAEAAAMEKIISEFKFIK